MVVTEPFMFLQEDRCLNAVKLRQFPNSHLAKSAKEDIKKKIVVTISIVITKQAG